MADTTEHSLGRIANALESLLRVLDRPSAPRDIGLTDKEVSALAKNYNERTASMTIHPPDD